MKYISNLVFMFIGWFFGRRNILSLVKEYERNNDILVCRNVEQKTKYNQEISKERFDKERYKIKWLIMNDWRILNQKGGTICDYFVDNHIEKIDIYGLGEMGRFLIDEILECKSDISISCIYDKGKNGMMYRNIPISYPPKVEEDIDVIIITTVMNREEISPLFNDSKKLIDIHDVIKWGLKKYDMVK